MLDTGENSPVGNGSDRESMAEESVSPRVVFDEAEVFEALEGEWERSDSTTQIRNARGETLRLVASARYDHGGEEQLDCFYGNDGHIYVNANTFEPDGISADKSAELAAQVYFYFRVADGRIRKVRFLKINSRFSS